MDTNRYGSWAIVTGASRGLGEGFARALAEEGLNLVLTARNEDALTALSAELEGKYSIETKVIAADLATENAADHIASETTGLEIGLLVNNATMVMGGALLKHEIDDELRMLDVNVSTPLKLTHHFGNLMKARGRGGIVFVSSMAGYNCMPYMASYIGTKSYLVALGEALHHELKPHGVDVLVLSPGLTDTNPNKDHDPIIGFGEVNAGSESRGMAVEAVVGETLDKLGKKMTVIPGTRNKFLAFAVKRLMRRERSAKLMAKMGGRLIDKDMR